MRSRNTAEEFRVLHILAVNATKVVTRPQIQSRVFSKKFVSRTLDVFVCTLRRKLRTLNLDIEAVRGVGYRLEKLP